MFKQELILNIWFPRILTVIYIIFLGIFALDVFVPGKTFIYYLAAFLIHLLPNFLMLIALVIAWRNQKLGGIIFLLIALLFTLLFKTYQFPWTFALISLPIFIIGYLFLRQGFSVP